MLKHKTYTMKHNIYMNYIYSETSPNLLPSGRVEQILFVDAMQIENTTLTLL